MSDLPLPSSSQASSPTRTLVLALAFSVAAAGACGGATSHPPGENGPGSSSGGGTGSSGGSSGGGSSGGGQATKCPASVPTGGSACPESNLSCEYGNDSDIGCDTVASCQILGVTGNTVWAVTPPAQTSETCPTPTPGQDGCPAAYPTLNTSCDLPSTLSCAYAQGLCGCSIPYEDGLVPLDGGSVVWVCENPGPGCPEPRPAAGTACGDEGLVCSYGSCDLPGGPAAMTCTGGAWSFNAFQACPLSANP